MIDQKITCGRLEVENYVMIVIIGLLVVYKVKRGDLGHRLTWDSGVIF